MSPSRRGDNSAALVIDIVVEAPQWRSQRGIKAVVKRAVEAAAAAVSTSAGELAIVLTDDSAIRGLNAQWRGKDEATNVLSFPAGAASANSEARLLGDIVIAYETTAREAEAEDKPFADHVAHLAVHGFLHLVGYDHEADAEAETMERLEARVLAGLNIPDPYIARSGKA